jgi:hypothetical protein
MYDFDSRMYYSISARFAPASHSMVEYPGQHPKERIMEIEGTVQNGVVVLESASALPEGTRVKVTAPDLVAPTHYDLFHDVIGQAEGVPEDLAKNHNHYIRGGPKQ